MATVTVTVASSLDVGRARRAARTLAVEIGFTLVDVETIALATSELVTNLVRYAKGGAIHLASISETGRSGLRLEGHDLGPGIDDTAVAVQDGLSTGGGPGGVRRLMDGLQLSSSPAGTHITAYKYLYRAA